jgi:hypothetical protein
MIPPTTYSVLQTWVNVQFPLLDIGIIQCGFSMLVELTALYWIYRLNPLILVHNLCFSECIVVFHFS